MITLIDRLKSPSGREQHTGRRAWRISDEEERVRWAFIEEHDGKAKISGYPTHPVKVGRADPVACAVMGIAVGVVVGVVVGGWLGAIVGVISGAIIGAAGAENMSME